MMKRHMFFHIKYESAEDPESNHIDYYMSKEQLMERFPWLDEVRFQDYLRIEMVTDLDKITIWSEEIIEPEEFPVYVDAQGREHAEF